MNEGEKTQKKKYELIFNYAHDHEVYGVAVLRYSQWNTLRDSISFNKSIFFFFFLYFKSRKWNFRVFVLLDAF